MGLHFWFRNPAGTFEEITDRVRLYTTDLTTNAEEATVATSEIIVDDPDGDLIIGGLRRFYVTEDTVASSSNQIVWNGYTAERTIIRGPYRNSVSRQWKVALVDHNTLLERRVLTGPSAKRPAETDVARIQWVEATAAADLIDDTQYLSTANGVAMDEADYSGQRVSDVVNDCMQQSGKNAFLWLREEVTVDDGPGAISLWYGDNDPTNGIYRSDAHLTNVAADVNLTTHFPISQDTELRRDPSRVYSGVYLQYGNNDAVYESLPSTAAAFALGGRDTTMLGENVKTAAKATARAQRYLADLDTEEDVITTVVHDVPRASVNRFMPGMAIRFRATHLPGYETETWLRILTRNVVETTEETYSIRLELSSSTGAVATVGSSSLAGDLTIGSAAYVGETVDRQFHSSDDLGLAPVTMIPGKQYRLIATLLNNFLLPIPDAAHPTYSSLAAGITVELVRAGTSTPLTNPDYVFSNTGSSVFPFTYIFGPSYIVNGHPTDVITLAPGAVFTGDWCTLTTQSGPIDIAISGTALSGFYGFLATVHVELQQRDIP